MEHKLDRLRKLKRNSKKFVDSICVVDENGNDIVEEGKGSNGNSDHQPAITETQVSVLNALLAGERTKTFQLNIFTQQFICFLSSGSGVLIGRGRFNEDNDDDTVPLKEPSDGHDAVLPDRRNAADNKHTARHVNVPSNAENSTNDVENNSTDAVSDVSANRNNTGLEVEHTHCNQREAEHHGNVVADLQLDNNIMNSKGISEIRPTGASKTCNAYVNRIMTLDDEATHSAAVNSGGHLESDDNVINECIRRNVGNAVDGTLSSIDLKDNAGKSNTTEYDVSSMLRTTRSTSKRKQGPQGNLGITVSDVGDNTELFVASRVGGYTVVLRGCCNAETSMLAILTTIRDIL